MNPSVRHILALSGGKDSTALAIYLRDRVPQMEYVFCDTHKELPETYEYLLKIEAYLGKPIIRLCDDRGFDHWLTIFNSYLPSTRMRWCTKLLKIKPFEKYVGDDEVRMYVGIRADEDREAYISSKPNIRPVYPFKEDGIDLAGVQRILDESGIGFPRYYDWRTRSGCYFCFFQRRNEWVGLKERHPDLYELAKAYEKTDPVTGMRYCEQVRSRLKLWTDPLPEGVLKLSDLTELQRKLLRLLLAPIPPQLPLLADGLVEVIQEDTATHDELLGGSSLTAFPAIERTWRDLRSKVDRYVEGVRAPLRTAVRELVAASEPLATASEPETPGTSAKVVAALQEAGKACGGDDNTFKRIADRVAAASPADPIEAVAAAVSGKPPAALTDEDFGKASGILEAAAAVRKQEAQHRASGQYMVVLPSGERRSLKSALQEDAEKQVAAGISRWRTDLSLPADQIAFSVLRVLFVDPPPRAAAEAAEEPPAPASEATQAGSPTGTTD